MTTSSSESSSKKEITSSENYSEQSLEYLEKKVDEIMSQIDTEIQKNIKNKSFDDIIVRDLLRSDEQFVKDNIKIITTKVRKLLKKHGWFIDRHYRVVPLEKNIMSISYLSQITDPYKFIIDELPSVFGLITMTFLTIILFGIWLATMLSGPFGFMISMFTVFIVFSTK